MDFLLTLVLLYLAYRFFYKGRVLDRGDRHEPPARQRDEDRRRPPADDDEGEYTDYEEVK